MSTSYQLLLLDDQRFFADTSSTSSKFAQPIMSAGTSISQVMGDIGVPRELSGFPATNMLETPEIYELHSKVFGVDKAVALELKSLMDTRSLSLLGFKNMIVQSKKMTRWKKKRSLLWLLKLKQSLVNLKRSEVHLLNKVNMLTSRPHPPLLPRMKG